MKICVLFIVLAAGVVSSQRLSEDELAVKHIKQRVEDFSIKMFQLMNQPDDPTELINPSTNSVFSPLSIFTALSVLGRGTNGNSLQQIKDALGLHAFDNIHKSNLITFAKDPNYKISFASRVYVDNSTLLVKDFKNYLESSGQPTVKKLDFRSRPEQARSKINSWVKRHTMNEISELLGEGSVTPLTRLYIVNALALKAEWEVKFSPMPGTFHVSPVRRVKAKMLKADHPCMSRETQYDPNPKELRDTTIIALPFRSEKLAFVMVMPNTAGDFSELMTVEGGRKLHNTVDQFFADTYGNGHLGYYTCSITMPKYSIEHEVNGLKSHLQSMGITDIFDTMLADVTRLVRDSNGYYVSDSIHKATFALDENGVKATAATAFGISSRMIPPSLTVDKPFLFMVKHVQSGAVLFMGKVANPNLSPFH